MNNIEIAVIINSFNRFSLLKECVVSLNWIENSKYKDKIAVIVFEAGSTDGSLIWLSENKSLYPFPMEIIIPKEGEDTSFSAGINNGVLKSQELYPKLKYLFFFETDNQIFSDGSLEKAEKQLQVRSELAACGFTVKKHNGESAGIGTTFPNLFHFLIGLQLTNRLHLDQLPLNWCKEDNDNTLFSFLDCVYTSPLLVSLKAWNQSGGLDQKVFPFSDCDVDWAKRLNLLGWKMGVVKTEDVIHDNRETLSAWSKMRAMQFHRGRLRYFKRFHPVLLYLVWPIPLMLRHIFEWLLVKIFIWNTMRRKQLSQQFNGLIKRCFYGYE